MGRPTPMAKLLEFPTPTPSATTGPSHVQVRADRRPSHRPAAAVVLFDWEANPDRPPMPTLIACALDLIGQHIENPLRVPKFEAVEALQAIRGHYATTAGQL